MADNQYHLVDVYKGAGQTFAGEADQVKVHVKRPYGTLLITVTDEGNVIFDSLDGEGEVLETSCLDPDDYVGDAQADDEEETCDECGGELEYVETKANGDLCKCVVCGHEQMTASEEEEDEDDGSG